MKKIHKIASLALALGMGLAVFAGCGASGNSWHYGDGAPAAELGVNGDMYMDRSTWDVYVKEDNAWSAQGNLKGGDGEEGDKGETGNGWLHGDGAPAASLGKDGDFYLDDTTCDAYVKENGDWKFLTNVDGSSDYYKDFFKKMTLTKGNLMIVPSSEIPTAAQWLFAASVQGLFAQTGESKYFLDVNDKYNTERLDEIKDKFKKSTENTTLIDMCTDYKKHFSSSGYVLYDAASNESMNCARTIAGARQLVMIDKSMTSWADEQGLVQKIDATNMTAEECFDTYHDELDNTGIMQERSYGYTDYAIACRYFSFYPETPDPEHPNPNDIYKDFREKVFAWSDGAPVFGDFPLGEYDTVKVNSFHNHPTIVGTGSANVTVNACVDAFGKVKYTQPNKPTDKDLSAENYPLDKHYVTIVNGDGDNVGCWLGGTFDPNGTYLGIERGKFPMGWEVNPSLAAMAPTILDNAFSNAKEGDTFVCSISGFGHTFLRYFTDKALKRYTNQLNQYIEKCDLSIVKILDDGSIQDEGRVIEAFSKMSNAEGFYYCTYGGAYKDDHGAVRWSENGKPVVSCRYTLWENFGEPKEIADQINASSTDARSIDGYSFVNLHLWSKSYSDVKDMVAQLDKDNVVVVDPITFIRLIKKNVPKVDAAPAN